MKYLFVCFIFLTACSNSNITYNKGENYNQRIKKISKVNHYSKQQKKQLKKIK
jgi:hypothetical protein